MLMSSRGRGRGLNGPTFNLDPVYNVPELLLRILSPSERPLRGPFPLSVHRSLRQPHTAGARLAIYIRLRCVLEVFDEMDGPSHCFC